MKRYRCMYVERHAVVMDGRWSDQAGEKPDLAWRVVRANHWFYLFWELYDGE